MTNEDTTNLVPKRMIFYVFLVIPILLDAFSGLLAAFGCIFIIAAVRRVLLYLYSYHAR